MAPKATSDEPPGARPDAPADRARVLLRIAFDGARYRGSQRQPGVPTVDGTLLAAAGEAGLLPDDGDARLRAQGRTDRGVSALDHPVAFDVRAGVSPDTVGRAVAGRTRAIVPWAGAEAPLGYDPRREATARTYHYVLPLRRVAGHDMDQVRAAWSAFVGTHDVSAFARVVRGKDPVRTITRARVHGPDPASGLVTFEVTGQSFLWNQVRRMVGAALDVGAGRLTVHAVEAALAGARLGHQHKVAPDGLVLARVDLPIETPPLPGPARLGLKRLVPDHDALTQRLAVLDGFMASLDRRAKRTRAD